MSVQNNSPLSYDEHSNEDVIDLRFLFGLLTAHKGFIFLVTLICVLLGGLYSATRPAIYESMALIKVEGGSSNASNMAALLGVAGGANVGSIMNASPAEIETSLIKSDYIMGPVVDRLKLNIVATPKVSLLTRVLGKAFSTYFKQDAILQINTLTVPKTLEGMPFELVVTSAKGDYVLYDQEGKEILKGTVGKLAVSENQAIAINVESLKAPTDYKFTVVKKPISSTVASLLTTLTIKEQGEKTGILQLNYKSQDPENSQQILNAIVKVAVEKNIAEKAEEATKTLTFLKEQLPNVTQDLDTAENRLNSYRSETGTVDDTVEAQILLQEIVSIEKDINELSLKKLEMQQNFTGKHPYLVAMDQKQAQLEKQLAEVTAKLKKIPLTSQGAMNFERDIKVHGEIYSGIMQNLQQMQILKGSTVSSVRVLETASFSMMPVPSKMPLILLISLVLGASLSTMILLLSYSLSRTLDPLVLEKILKLQVMAVVPYSQAQAKLFREMRSRKVKRENYLLCLEQPKDTSIEALRSLRTALKLMSLSENKKIIAISGCSPNVGKSFVSSNLASLLSDLGEKILIIDADMRKGYLNKIFSCQSSPGLSEYLKDEVSLEKSIHKILPNVDLMTTGNYPENPSELLMHHRFKNLIQEASQRYDIILIDTPPVLAVTDASLIFKFADIKLLLVGSGKDQLKEIEHTKGVLEKSGLALDGIIYNNLQQTEKKYGYNGRYNFYNYSYKYE